MRAAVSSGSATSHRQDAVRITEERDLEDDQQQDDDATKDVEVKDIGADSSEDEESPPRQSAIKRKRKSAEAGGAAGLANVIRGLLLPSASAAGGGCPILAKALTDRQRFAPADGVPAADGEDADAGDDLPGRRRRRLTAERRRWLCAGRCKPLPSDREAERQLERIACRGVVQLFNAVRAQQRSLEARLAGRSEAARQRVLASLSKADFLDMLAGRRKAAGGKLQKRSADSDDSQQQEEEQEEKKSAKKTAQWGALADDYLVKPTLSLKDWDRDSSSGASDGELPMEEDG